MIGSPTQKSIYLNVALVVGLLPQISEAQFGAGYCGSGQCPPPGWLSSPQAPVRSEAIPSAIRDVVCRVIHRSSEGTFLGSGVLIEVPGKEPHVLTCSHVLGNGAGQTKVQFLGVAVAEASIVARDAVHDLALLRLQHPLRERRALPAGKLTRQAPLFAYGYGGGTRLRSVSGRILGTATAEGARYPSVRINATVESGDSGGPVLDGQGRVVAVVWGVQGRVTYAMFGPPLERLLASVSSQAARAAPREPRDSSPRWADLEKRLVAVEENVVQQSQTQQQWRRTFKPCQCDGNSLTVKDLESYARREELDRFVDQDRFAAAEATRQREQHQLRLQLGKQITAWTDGKSSPPASQTQGPLSLTAWQILLGAVGISSPVGVAIFAGQWLVRGRRNRRAKQREQKRQTREQQTREQHSGLGGPRSDPFPSAPAETGASSKNRSGAEPSATL